MRSVDDEDYDYKQDNSHPSRPEDLDCPLRRLTCNIEGPFLLAGCLRVVLRFRFGTCGTVTKIDLLSTGELTRVVVISMRLTLVD